MSERNERIDRQERNAKKIRLSADSNSQTTAALNTTAGTSSQSHRERGAHNTNTNSNTNLNNSNNNNNSNNSNNNLNNNSNNNSNERQNGERDNKDIKMNPKMSKALSTSAKRFQSFYFLFYSFSHLFF
jgi:hypothetical protein